MYIIHSEDLPEAAIQRLSKYGTLISIGSEGITHPSITSHPDIFCTIINQQMIIAPNSPKEFVAQLNQHHIQYIYGEKNIGAQKENSSHYNICISDDFVIHNPQYTDPCLLKYLKNRKIIATKQGYSRCTTLPLRQNHFLTSDDGVAQQLKKNKLSFLKVNSQDIVLQHVKHGFIGGCMGVHEDKIFIIGNLNYFSEGTIIKEYFSNLGYEIIELYDGPLYDGGSLLFLTPKFNK